ncbi:MAG TPA: hypothetical protein VF463_20285 [Sphingobium sp.]
MDHAVRPIAMVQGASGAVIQRLFCDLGDRWAPTVRLVGAVAYSAA